MMSRRESRVSMGARQNDALLEFENFKKKFLLANKHITKLNSTLSIRIEELNAQISSLYVENLRLRASEIALAAQLKREREKSRKIMAEAEGATLNLTNHLVYLRQSFNIPSTAPSPASPPSPRARKPPSTLNSNLSSPQGNRISRPPNVPGIYEDDEAGAASENDVENLTSPLPRKPKARSRLSASRLPLPARSTSPTPLSPQADTLSADLSNIPHTKLRKVSRRQSGFLSTNPDALSVPRAPSPAFGSPIRRAAGLAVEEEEIAAVADQLQAVDVEDAPDLDVEVKPLPKKDRRKSRGKEKERSADEGLPGTEETPQERERGKERKRIKERVDEDKDGGGKPRLKNVTNSRAALLPIDNTVHDQTDSGNSPTFLSSSPTLSAPTSRSSTSPAPPGETESSAAGGRERRLRKSVNYAEPKLNTKMRKPDSSTAPPPSRKRASAAAILSTTAYHPRPEDTGNDADNDTETRSSVELPLHVTEAHVNPELLPLPPSRPSSSVQFFSPPPTPMSGSSATTSVKRKKSRPQIDLEDDESDGAEADAEYVGYTGLSGWVNIEGRKRAVTSKRSSTSSTPDETRRHSMAV